MSPELALAIACLLLGALVGLPALEARRRAHISRGWSEVAVELTRFAADVRKAGRWIAVGDAVLERLHGLRIPEVTAFQLVCELRHAHPELLSAAAQRLALRLKRRAAFERKMLARTASGRRRGAVAAAAPAMLLVLAKAGGVALPLGALGMLVVLEALGCWMLWRVARVDV